MRFLFLLLIFFCLGCGSNFGSYDPITAYELAMRKQHRQTPCTMQRLKIAYARLYSGFGCGECALYYLRCKRKLGVERILLAPTHKIIPRRRISFYRRRRTQPSLDAIASAWVFYPRLDCHPSKHQRFGPSTPRR